MRQLWKRACISAFVMAVALNSLSAVRADEPSPKVPDAVLEKFTKQDRDGDKQLSVDEFRVWYGAAQAAVALRDFDLFDRNADGQLSLEEYWSLPTHPIGQRGPLPDPMTEIVNQFVAILDQL